MTLDEIRGASPADTRVQRLKANAKAAKERARQLKAQADIGADRLKLQKARAALAQSQRSVVTSTIKPYR